MKKILLAIIIFVSAFTITYAQCTLPIVTITSPAVSTIAICEGTPLTLSGTATATGAPQNGSFTYTWKKIVSSSTISLTASTDITLPIYITTPVPSYTINSATIADAGTYILRMEDGNAGNASCYTEASVTVTVNPKPTISGNLNVCVRSNMQLTGSGIANETSPWTSASPTIAQITYTGIVIGVSAGTSQITYLNDKGCKQTTTINVNPIPTITGDLIVCNGHTTQLTGSGIPASTNAWTSASPTIATVDNTGLVTSLASSGSSVISYTTSEGCKQTVTVGNVYIGGTLDVCIGSTTKLTAYASPATTNAWVSSDPAIATIDNTGLVTGIAIGTSEITYTALNGCQQTAIITVNGLPTITGNLTTCDGFTTQLIGSGIPSTIAAWISATPAVATVGTNTGIVTGVSAGTSTITYITNKGCKQTATVTVYSRPAITGTLLVCLGSTTQLTVSGTPATTNAWASSDPAIATIDNTGLVTGLAVGTSTITYASAIGCIQTVTVTVTNATLTPSVSIITNPGSNICSGTNVTFRASPFLGGTPTYVWTSSVNGILTATTDTYSSSNLVDGEVISVSMTSTISCASPAAASSSVTMNVLSGSSLPTVSITSDKTAVCAGSPVTFYKTATTHVIVAPSYEWFIESNGNQISQGVPSSKDYFITSALQPNDKVFVRITSNDVCTNPIAVASNALTILVHAPVSAGSISADQTICSGTTPAKLTEVTASDAASPSFVWESSVTSNAATWVPVSSSNNSDLILSDSYNADVYFRRIVIDASKPSPCKVAVTDQIHITVVPCATFAAAITGDAQITAGQQNVAYSVPDQPGFSYEWSITGGTIVSGQNTNAVTVNWDVPNSFARTTAFVYSISVTETNQGNQSNTTTLELTTLTTATTKSQAQSGVKLFPNPTAGSFSIEMPESGTDVSYEILDLTGLSVASGTFTSSGNDQHIDADLKAGMYQIVLKYNNVVTCVRLSKIQ